MTSTRDAGRHAKLPSARFYAVLLTAIIIVSVISHTLIRLFG